MLAHDAEYIFNTTSQPILRHRSTNAHIELSRLDLSNTRLRYTFLLAGAPTLPVPVPGPSLSLSRLNMYICIHMHSIFPSISINLLFLLDVRLVGMAFVEIENGIVNLAIKSRPMSEGSPVHSNGSRYGKIGD